MSPKRAALLMKCTPPSPALHTPTALTTVHADNLRAATPNYPYDPYSMEPGPIRNAGARPYRIQQSPVPEQIERTCQMTAIEIANEHKAKGEN